MWRGKGAFARQRGCTGSVIPTFLFSPSVGLHTKVRKLCLAPSVRHFGKKLNKFELMKQKMAALRKEGKIAPPPTQEEKEEQERKYKAMVEEKKNNPEKLALKKSANSWLQMETLLNKEKEQERMKKKYMRSGGDLTDVQDMDEYEIQEKLDELKRAGRAKRTPEERNMGYHERRQDAVNRMRKQGRLLEKQRDVVDMHYTFEKAKQYKMERDAERKRKEMEESNSTSGT